MLKVMGRAIANYFIIYDTHTVNVDIIILKRTTRVEMFDHRIKVISQKQRLFPLRSILDLNYDSNISSATKQNQVSL